jgi:chromosome segregation ATPase
MFGKTSDAKIESLTEEIRGLTKRVAELKGERDEVSEELGLSARIVSLEREKTAKEIELDRVKEQHAREKREVEHMVGLHKDRVKQEIELAKREQSITVREENLKADRERFEQQMQFMQKRMETELERLNNLTSEILERLPTVKVDRRITETIGAASNGHGGDDDDA